MGRVLNFTLGLLVGGLVGATVVLLLTPQSGEDLQKRVKEEIDILLEEGKKASSARKAELEAKMTRIQTGTE